MGSIRCECFPRCSSGRNALVFLILGTFKRFVKGGYIGFKDGFLVYYNILQVFQLFFLFYIFLSYPLIIYISFGNINTYRLILLSLSCNIAESPRNIHFIQHHFNHFQFTIIFIQLHLQFMISFHANINTLVFDITKHIE